MLEHVDVPVEDGVNIANFRSGAVIFDKTVGLQRIRADLTAEGDGVFSRILGLPFGFSFLDFQIIEPGLEDAQRRMKSNAPNEMDNG